MKVINHKDTKADIVIIFSNGYADNLKLSVDKATAAPQKISASEYRWTKTLLHDEVWQLGWKEDYFR
jgi:hypothetical protein